MVSIVVPAFGLTSVVFRIPQGNPTRNYNGDYSQIGLTQGSEYFVILFLVRGFRPYLHRV